MYKYKSKVILNNINLGKILLGVFILCSGENKNSWICLFQTFYIAKNMDNYLDKDKNLLKRICQFHNSRQRSLSY